MELLVALAIIVGILALVVELFFPFIKGKLGENFASTQFLKLDPKNYKVIDDLLLPSHGSLPSTQIDHVIVSTFGIYCIETKNYSGWIFGNSKDQYWTQVIYRRKERFYSPLRQNYAHIKALEALLQGEFPKVPIIGFVAFPSAGKINVSGTAAVGHVVDIKRKILEITTPILTDDEKNRILDILYAANIQDKELRKQHTQSVRNLVNTKR